MADLEALECDQSREVGRSWHKLVVCMQISAYLCEGFIMSKVPQTYRIWLGLTEFGPPIWQAEAVIVRSLSDLPATAVGRILLVYGIMWWLLHTGGLQFNL